jgi:serine/threonine protein kinase
LRSFRSEDHIPPFSSGRSAIGLVSLLAPFGSLKVFLSHPPEGALIDEMTSSPLIRSKGGVLSPDIKFSILFDVCGGLSYLHSQGYLHGRLHHNNVLIFPGFRARLTDFGIAHQLATPSRKYIRKTDEIEVVEHKERFGYSKIGNDPRWYAPEIVLRNINIENKKVKSTNQMSSDSFGTIAVSASLSSLSSVSVTIPTERYLWIRNAHLFSCH